MVHRVRIYVKVRKLRKFLIVEYFRIKIDLFDNIFPRATIFFRYYRSANVYKVYFCLCGLFPFRLLSELYSETFGRLNSKSN